MVPLEVTGNLAKNGEKCSVFNRNGLDELISHRCSDYNPGDTRFQPETGQTQRERGKQTRGKINNKTLTDPGSSYLGWGLWALLVHPYHH